MSYWQFRAPNIKHLVLVLLCRGSNLSFAQQDTVSLVSAKKIRLDEAILLGIKNNRQLKLANADLAIANENVGQAKIAKMPRINLNGGYNYIGDPKLYNGFYESQVTVDYYNHQAFANVVSSLPIYAGNALNTRINQQELITQMQAICCENDRS
ncbi:TolC family protein [Flavobacterium ginsengisoli]|uniref:TolC family protein n=1 Tax=Flavobacterium ginsengisoli TaxID=871694 RepID=UPI0024155D95|nr:TolC family protein [Flavobacterium ginsengisoli]